jgi:hypothetical protein
LIRIVRKSCTYDDPVLVIVTDGDTTTVEYCGEKVAVGTCEYISDDVPRHDWMMKDIDGEATGERLCDTSPKKDEIYREVYVPIELLPPGAIPDDDDDPWQGMFHKDSVYPPIGIELVDNDIAIHQGNHRVIMWRKWGFKYAPAWIVYDKGKVLPQGVIIRKEFNNDARSVDQS